MFFLEKDVGAIDDAQKLIFPDIVLICLHTLNGGGGMSMRMVADDGRRLHLSVRSVGFGGVFFKPSHNLHSLCGRKTTSR
jgi:hypothetical protein